MRRSTTVAEVRRMTAADVVAGVLAGEHGDFVREAVAVVEPELMEAEVGAEVGAQLGQVSEARSTYRNRYRPRPCETRVGEIELLIPRTRHGSYFPSFLEARRRSEQRSSLLCWRAMSTVSRRARLIVSSSSWGLRG
jgi:putative transposase